MKPPGRERSQRWELAAVGAIAATFVATGAALVARHAPMLHDEAVYALRAGHYAGEQSGIGYWNPYRSVGLPLLLRLVWPVGETDGVLRAVNLAIGAIGVVVCAAWARRMFGRGAGVVAAACLVAMPWYLAASHRLFVDLPAAVLALLCAMVFAGAIDADRVSSRAFLAVPFAAGAMLVRYGSTAILAAALGVLVVVHLPQARRSWRTVLGVALAIGAVVAAVLLVPAVTGASRAPLAAFLDQRASKGRSRWASVGDFLDVLPDVVGPVVAVVVAAALAGVVYGARAGRWRPSLLAIAAGTVLVFFGLINVEVGTGYAQYLVPALPFLALAIAGGTAPVVERLAPALVVLLVVPVVAAGSLISYRDSADRGDVARRQFTVLRDAAWRLEAREGGECFVFTSYSPQVGWYSGCEVAVFPPGTFGAGGATDAAELAGLLRDRLRRYEGDVDDDAPVYWLLANRGKRQPAGETAAALESLTVRTVLELGDPSDGRLQQVRVGLLGTFASLTDRTP